MRLTRYVLMLALFAGSLALFPGGLRAQQAQSTEEPVPASQETNPPIPSPKPTADDPKIHKMAVQQFLAWQSGTVDRSLYSDRVNGDMTDEVMDRGTKTLANLGGLQQVQFQGIASTKGVSFYVYKMVCQNGTILMDFALDPDGRIGLIFFE